MKRWYVCVVDRYRSITVFAVSAGGRWSLTFGVLPRVQAARLQQEELGAAGYGGVANNAGGAGGAGGGDGAAMPILQRLRPG